jgi:nicotinamide mononucleotide transporter
MSISRSTWIFLAVGLLLQVLTFSLMPATPLSLLSGMLGVCSVVLGAQGNILTFLFGFAQVVTYTYLCCLERFYAEIAMNAYYFFTMIYGVYCWRKQLKKEDGMNIQTRTMQPYMLAILTLVVLILSVGVGWGLAYFTDDSQPYLDAFTTVPALVAQILMVLVFREQWYLWLLVDVLATVMWLRAGNYCMAAQYAFWCTNCVYGYIQWTRALKKDKG